MLDKEADDDSSPNTHVGTVGCATESGIPSR